MGVSSYKWAFRTKWYKHGMERAGIDLPYVLEPHELNLPHVPDPEDEAYLELLDLDALSAESVASAASVVITEPQKSNPTLINLSSNDENEYPEPVIPPVEIIDISLMMNRSSQKFD
ncbi:hypothetical protein L3X38_026041 [Prunus dulcis]|uniref:Uncharacterized protein n=1 Tax=Prunus dulcis TaxID=3755 RepID=A0AAD4W4P0_PRUDU|nr:hypothetical protein L3X38_026041 [Prunus dulcis]